MKTDKITKKQKDYKNINHVDLKFDFENDNIIDTFLIKSGKVEDSPEMWRIECCDSDGELVYDYLYDNKAEYENDLRIVGLLT